MKYHQGETDYLVSEYIDKVIWGGQSQDSFAKEHNVSGSLCNGFRRTISLVRRGDAEKIIDALNDRKQTNITPNALDAVYKAVGKPAPKEVREAIDNYRQDELQMRRENARKGGEATKAAAEQKRSEEDKQTTPLWAQSMLLNQAKAIEQLGDLNDAVIPKYAKDIVDALNKLDTHMVAILNKL